MYDRIARVEHVDHARKSAHHCVETLLTSQTKVYVHGFCAVYCICLSSSPFDQILSDAGMITFRISTREFLSMKEVLGKFGGNFMAIMVHYISRFLHNNIDTYC
jgi:hypothetical protein